MCYWTDWHWFEKILYFINFTSALITGYALRKKYENIKISKIHSSDDSFFIDFLNEETIKEKDLKQIEKETLVQCKNNVEISSVKVTREQIDNGININSRDHKKIIDCWMISNKLFINDCATVSAKYVKYLKFVNLAGVYVKNNKGDLITAQRIHGYSNFNREQFLETGKQILLNQERDHRKIGGDMELFMLSKIIGAGLPIWLPKGVKIKNKIKYYLSKKEIQYGFQEVNTPILGTKSLYEISGHWDHYKEDMFNPIEQEHETFVLRPMACPHHIFIYKLKPRSYKELPIRYCENATMYRYEASGALSGLERVRVMELTDAHIFASFNDVKSELKKCLQLIFEVLNDFKIKISYCSLSIRDNMDKYKNKYYDDDELWNKAEKILKETLEEAKIEYKVCAGEAAFYGPKIDIQIITPLNHEVTISTLQLDFLLPNKFDLKFIDKDRKKENIIMIHRGLIGTYERFIALLLEQYKGELPLWLSPTPIVIIPVHEKFNDYANYINQKLIENEIDALIDASDKRFNYKIYKAQSSKIPYQIIVGEKEEQQKKISYRKYKETITHSCTINEFIELIKIEIKNKR